MENKCIGCSVEDCKFHMEGKNFCTLSSINIGKDGENVSSPHCTCCNSFIKKEN